MNDKQEKLQKRIAQMENNKAEEQQIRQDVFDNRDKKEALHPGETEFSKEYAEEEILNNTPVDLPNENSEEKKSVSTTVKGKKKNQQKTNKKKGGLFSKVPKTAQETIPYLSVYKNGIIEVSENIFTKSYVIGDVNFSIASDEQQEDIFMKYGTLLNMFGEGVKAEITIFNRNVNIDKFKKEILLKLKGDGLDKYRLENNAIMEAKMNEGKNNITHEKYLTLSLEANDIDEAIKKFAKLDNDVSVFIKKINNIDTQPMTIEERLNVLYDIYNLNADMPFQKKAKISEHPTQTFDLNWLKRQGITTKDVIAPSSVSFNHNSFMLGDKYGKTMFIGNLPTYLGTDLLTELTDISCNMLTSVHFESLGQDRTVKLIRNQLVNINSNVIDAQKKAARNGYSPELISTDLKRAQEQANQLMDDITTRNQKLFLVTVAITVFADNPTDLDRYASEVKTVAQKHLCNVKDLNYQQEYGFTASLPLAYNKLYVQRLLTTEAASVFIPFSAQELSQNRGMYYGLNAVSKNLILFNRLNSKNANGVILGTPGSGKSFSAKREMINVLLTSDDDIYVIDPEREYAPLAALFGGEVVKIAAGSKTYINPLDMDINYADDDDPVTLKSDFIGSLCETIIGGKYGLSPIQKSVIDRCVILVYQPYLEHMAKLGSSKSCDKAAMPTLDDFYQLLLKQPEPEAHNLALSLELYCRGSLDTFAHRTNVNTSSRFIIYDIKDIGSGMKEMGLQVCLNDIWNKIISNKKLGKRTWFYIDEFYLLTQTDSSARFLQQVYKRARKWNGIPTGITQNVEDLLASKEARGIINNCDFIYMLNQSPLDRAELAAMLNMSPAQVSYITNSDAGQGLLYTGKHIIPFIDKFPTNNSLYKAMTTKPDEVDLDKFTV